MSRLMVDLVFGIVGIVGGWIFLLWCFWLL